MKRIEPCVIEKVVSAVYATIAVLCYIIPLLVFLSRKSSTSSFAKETSDRYLLGLINAPAWILWSLMAIGTVSGIAAVLVDPEEILFRRSLRRFTDRNHDEIRKRKLLPLFIKKDKGDNHKRLMQKQRVFQM